MAALGFHVSMDPLEGLVLHTVGFEDNGRVRPIVYRASVCEMVVPYGSPDPGHVGRALSTLGSGGSAGWPTRSPSVAIAWARSTTSMWTSPTSTGHGHTLPNAICMHEEDYGILWKHVDLMSQRTEVRRSRRLVVSSIATVGNYEYGFYWYFYLDGTLQLEVKLTGILSTQAVEEGSQPSHSSVVAPGLAAPFHQHLFSARLDVEVDGPANTVYEVNCEADPPGDANPWLNAFGPRGAIDQRVKARRQINPATSRHWKVTNGSAKNRLGQSTAYKLVPGPSPTLLADASSSVGQRAAYAGHQPLGHAVRSGRAAAAGDHPNQHRGGAGLPAWTSADRPLVKEDVVLWHTFG